MFAFSFSEGRLDACILEHALFWSGWRDFLLKPIPKEIVKDELYDFESA